MGIQEKKLSELVLGKMSGLNHTFRFSGMKKIRNQSVSEHSYWTAVIAASLAYYENEQRIKNGTRIAPVEVLKVYESSLMHDIEEILSGDIIHTFKHSKEGSGFINELDSLIKKVLPVQIFDKILSGDVFLKSWEDSHHDSEYSYLVKMGDWFQLLQYSVEEYELGNKNFESIILKVLELIKTKNDAERYVQKRLLFVPDLIENFIKEFLEDFKKGYDEKRNL